MGYRQTPVLGVNLGKLGFLADLSLAELRRRFPPSPAASSRHDHLMFECLIDGSSPRRTFLGLNEIAVQTAPPFHMLELGLVVDGEPASRYSGDGLIVSARRSAPRPTASRRAAPSSAMTRAFVITPICPHTLTNRPVVDSADKVYTISVRRRSSGANSCGDRRPGIRPAERGDTITVRRAPVTFGLVKAAGRSYYQTLRDKLHWGEQ